ncbi:MAG: ComEC family competence protein [Candidatus Omnitrophica bacterium]|nr:ComEC family competence protein [Candidatus Omnitrophota bacterium]
MKRPLVWLAFVFSLGIFVANFIRVSFWLIYALAAILLISSFLTYRKELFFILILCLVFTLGIICLKNSYYLPKRHIYRQISYPKDNPYLIKGFIESQPLCKFNRTSFKFKTQEIQFQNLRRNSCGSILVHLHGRSDLNYGDELIILGNLHRPTYRRYLYNQDIWFILGVERQTSIIKLNKNRGLSLKRLTFSLKNKMQAINLKYLSGLASGILDAMVLGDKAGIAPGIYNSMIKSGTVHILVVSGFNVGIVTFIIFLILKLIRVPRILRFYISLPLLIIYCLLTGASTPVVRATVMAVVFILGNFIKRQPDIYNSLSVASLFILGFCPRQLFDIGFELSFMSVLAIVFLYPKIKAFLRLDSLKIRIIRYLASGCIVSFAAWLGTMGFIAYYFKFFSPVTVLANLFIVPLAALITLCGFSLVAAGLFSHPLAPLFTGACEFLAALLVNFNFCLLKIPASYFYLP